MHMLRLFEVSVLLMVGTIVSFIMGMSGDPLPRALAGTNVVFISWIGTFLGEYEEQFRFAADSSNLDYGMAGSQLTMMLATNWYLLRGALIGRWVNFQFLVLVGLVVVGAIISWSWDMMPFPIMSTVLIMSAVISLVGLFASWWKRGFQLTD